MSGPRRENPEVIPPGDYEVEEVVLWSIIDNLARTVGLFIDIEVPGMPPVVPHTVLEARIICERRTIEEHLQRFTGDDKVIYIIVLQNLHKDIKYLKLLYLGAPIFVPLSPYVGLSEDSSISTSSAPTSLEEQALLDESLSEPSSNSSSPRAQALQIAKGSASIADSVSDDPIYQNVDFETRIEIRLEILLGDLILPGTIAKQRTTSVRAKLKHKLISKMKKEPRPKVENSDENMKNKIAVLQDILDNLMRLITLLSDFVLPGLPPLKYSKEVFVFQHRRLLSGEEMFRQPGRTAAQIFVSQHKPSSADHLLWDKAIESTNFKNVIGGFHQYVNALSNLYYQRPGFEDRNVRHNRASQTEKIYEKLIDFVTGNCTFPRSSRAAAAPPSLRASSASEVFLYPDVLLDIVTRR